MVGATRIGLGDGDLWVVELGLRVRRGDAAAALDPIVARHRTEHALRVASLQPRGLPRGAVLFVRRLGDPLPGGLALRRAAAAPAPAWEEAMRRTLDHRLAAAARPGRGPVPPGAESVLFDDLSHLLAWLGRDVADRVAATRWWWRPLLGGEAPAAALARAWREEAHAVPAAIARLAELGDAGRVAAAIEPRAASALVGEVARRFGVGELARAIVERIARPVADPEAAAPHAPEAAIVRAVEAARTHALPVAAVATAPAWAPWIGDAADGAPSAAAALVVLGLLIVRAPSLIHDRRWVAAIAAPAEVAPQRPRTAAASMPHAPPGSASRALPAAIVVGGDEPARTPVAAVESIAASGPPAPVAPPREPAPAATAAIAPAIEAPATAVAPPPMPAWIEPVEPPPADPTGWRPFNPPAVHAWGAPIDTELGGLFYLLNVGLFLELYGDFTQPLAPGLTLPIWDFVELVGRGLLDEPAPDDPVWALLAALASREVGRAGDGFEPPAGWIIPPAWLAPLGDAARASLAAIAGAPWLDAVIAYIRLRLAAALGAEPAAVADLVLRHRARVHASPTHVDVVFSLAGLPLPIRFAGLDRDPGWIPSAQRTVAFHYEAGPA